MEDPNEDLFAFMSKVIREIESNTDHREKCIGDKARVWDGSANVDDKGKSRSGIDPLFRKTAIVSDVNCNKKFLKRGYAGVEDSEEILDIELYFPDEDRKVWTKSRYVQLEDFEAD